MVKRLANKTTREILTDVEVREKGLNMSDFTPTWQGRVVVLGVEHSRVAKDSGFQKNGEYAIKVR